jgi:hypothetical protein
MIFNKMAPSTYKKGDLVASNVDGTYRIYFINGMQMIAVPNKGNVLFYSGFVFDFNIVYVLYDRKTFIFSEDTISKKQTKIFNSWFIDTKENTPEYKRFMKPVNKYRKSPDTKLTEPELCDMFIDANKVRY